jgi:hypothetical protein
MYHIYSRHACRGMQRISQALIRSRWRLQAGGWLLGVACLQTTVLRVGLAGMVWMVCDGLATMSCVSTLTQLGVGLLSHVNQPFQCFSLCFASESVLVHYLIGGMLLCRLRRGCKGCHTGATQGPVCIWLWHLTVCRSLTRTER